MPGKLLSIISHEGNSIETHNKIPLLTHWDGYCFFLKKKKKRKKEKENSWAQVAHTYNPSYSRSRDQEDRGLKPGQANSL
jgi:hypothetical protein